MDQIGKIPTVAQFSEAKTPDRAVYLVAHPTA